jgi:hypothetical protein
MCPSGIGIFCSQSLPEKEVKSQTEEVCPLLGMKLVPLEQEFFSRAMKIKDKTACFG